MTYCEWCVCYSETKVLILQQQFNNNNSNNKKFPLTNGLIRKEMTVFCLKSRLNNDVLLSNI